MGIWEHRTLHTTAADQGCASCKTTSSAELGAPVRRGMCAHVFISRVRFLLFRGKSGAQRPQRTKAGTAPDGNEKLTASTNPKQHSRIQWRVLVSSKASSAKRFWFPSGEHRRHPTAW